MACRADFGGEGQLGARLGNAGPARSAEVANLSPQAAAT